jgi:hypothetical protein
LEQPSSSKEDLVVTSVVRPGVSTANSFSPLANPTLPVNPYIAVTVVVRLACGLSSESGLIVIHDSRPSWPVLLVKKADWANKKLVKITLHKELASWLPVMDSSTRYPLISGSESILGYG